MADYGLFHSIRLLWTAVYIVLLIPVDGLAIKRNTPSGPLEITANDKTYIGTRDLDSQIVDFLTKHRYSGCTVGVAKQDGTVLYTQGYGSMNDGGRLKSSSILPASSISKLLTAMGVLKLVEEGRLTLSDFVFGNGAVLGQLTPFPFTKAADQRLFDIRVIHLLHHTSGLQSYVSELNDVKLMRGHKVPNISEEMRLEKQLTTQDVIRYTCGQSLVSDPGRTFAYSNLGYAILGEIIAEKSDVGYEEYINREILEPLGMWKTTTCPDSGSTLNNDHGDSIDISATPHLRSSLGWHSSVHDFLRLMNGLQDGKILSPRSLQRMMAPPASPVSEHKDQWYGMGVHVGNDGSWWQVGDPHTNEVLLYQSGHRTTDSLGNRLKWVVLLPENRHRNIRTDFVKILGTAVDWPSSHDPIKDCADVSFSDNGGDYFLLNAGVPVGHFRAFVTTMSLASFHPTWVDVYQDVDRPLVSSVWHKSNASFTTNIIEINISSDALRKKVDELLSRRLYLKSIAPYLDGRHQQRYIASFGDSTSGLQQVGWETTQDIYEKSSQFFTEELSLVPTVKAVLAEGERKIVSFIFDRSNASSWSLFDEVPPGNIRSLALAMAKQGRTMVYAKSYNFHGGVYFSTIFADVHESGMQLDLELDRESLIGRTKIMQGRNFRPKLISGYSTEGETRFLILWTRMGLK